MASFNQPYPVQPGNYPPMQQQQHGQQQHGQQQHGQQQQGQQQQQPQPMQTGMGMQQVPSNLQQSQTLGVMGQLPLSLQTQQQPQQQAQMMSPTKEPNYALLCRAGQEYVHEIVTKTSIVFETLKVIQLPNGLTHQAAMQTFKDRKAKTDELLQAINASFRKLRLVYDTVMEYTSSMANPPIESLLPFEGSELDERGKNTEMYRFVSEEHKEVYEQVRHKNQQIKEVIGQMRNLIWEINTMISMRKS